MGLLNSLKGNRIYLDFNVKTLGNHPVLPILDYAYPRPHHQNLGSRS